jgi:hypothetical protein
MASIDSLSVTISSDFCLVDHPAVRDGPTCGFGHFSQNVLSATHKWAQGQAAEKVSLGQG